MTYALNAYCPGRYIPVVFWENLENFEIFEGEMGGWAAVVTTIENFSDLW